MKSNAISNAIQKNFKVYYINLKYKISCKTYKKYYI